MEIQLKLLPTLLLLGAIQGIILSFILFFFKKNKNTLSNRILSVAVFLMAINLLYAVIFTSGIILRFPWLLRTIETIQFLSPPLIFLYVYSLTEKEFKLKSSYFLYAIPFVIGSLYLIFYGGSIDEKIIFYNNFKDGQIDKSFKIIYGLKVLYGLVFLALSFKKLAAHIKLIPHLFESIENKKLLWLRNLLFFLTLTWCIVLIRPFIEFNTNSVYFIGISVSVIIYLITINQLKQQTIYAEIPKEILDNVQIKTSEKQTKPQLSKDKLSALFLTLDQYCKTEKPYLEHICNLNFIAQKTAIKPYLISQVLNIYAQKTFNEYLNELKVIEAEKNLISNKYNLLTIDAIGELSGFRSKATFYSAFKKKHNITPQQYRKQQIKTF